MYPRFDDAEVAGDAELTGRRRPQPRVARHFGISDERLTELGWAETYLSLIGAPSWVACICRPSTVELASPRMAPGSEGLPFSLLARPSFQLRSVGGSEFGAVLSVRPQIQTALL